MIDMHSQLLSVTVCTPPLVTRGQHSMLPPVMAMLNQSVT